MNFGPLRQASRMILMFYARNATNVLVKLLAVRRMADACNPRYHAPCSKKLHKDAQA